MEFGAIDYITRFGFEALYLVVIVESQLGRVLLYHGEILAGCL